MTESYGIVRFGCPRIDLRQDGNSYLEIQADTGAIILIQDEGRAQLKRLWGNRLYFDRRTGPFKVICVLPERNDQEFGNLLHCEYQYTDDRYILGSVSIFNHSQKVAVSQQGLVKLWSSEYGKPDHGYVARLSEKEGRADIPFDPTSPIPFVELPAAGEDQTTYAVVQSVQSEPLNYEFTVGPISE